MDRKEACLDVEFRQLLYARLRMDLPPAKVVSSVTDIYVVKTELAMCHPG